MQPDILKYNLLDKLISINDNSLLQKVNELIGNVDVEKNVFKVTEDQQRMLMESEDDIRNENLISDEDVNQEEDKWLFLN